MDPTTWRTYLVTGAAHSAGRDTPSVVADALDGGIDAVQLRDKEATARQRYHTGQRLRELTEAAGVPLVVNDRIDLARAIDADGVHLGQSDLPAEVARDQLGQSAIVGVSASTVAEATTAEAAGADYLGVGAVFGTTSKDVPDEENGIDTERVKAIADAVDIPVIGIGGIDATNAGSVVEAGATGVAVISAITAADDPQAATAALREVVSDV
ncbi:thiamine-phosphate pyrophosphorylase [Halorubrum alkaliphilum]|uniref:Thiamine-phosphate synthase n=1 Tax=Halorubrum alkaliphilum TaxID=261290 RepID=A0A8T4GH55_9EURY|nr:thiamine phosphate synthase [Halorubrum alkaliphilum]MBP1923059.1 thiamine-phosphate pyrophosphorylase [Halorubrum alkaliphilum]